MERGYQPSAQLHSQSCFLSPLDEHHHILLDLNGTVAITAIQDAPLPTIPSLTTTLITRHGGSPSNWRFKIIHHGFLVKPPDWVSPDDLLLDYELWEPLRLAVHPWQCIESSSPLPPCTRAHISIHDFPLEFWHPFYFRQAVTSMGTLVGVSSEALRGLNRKEVGLVIDCPDLNLVPFTLRVGHRDRWTDCHVVLEGRPSALESHDQPPQPPPLNPPRASQGESAQGNATSFRTPYIPPPRRVLRYLHPPYPDHARRAAPAVSLVQTKLWSTATPPAPCPCTKLPLYQNPSRGVTLPLNIGHQHTCIKQKTPLYRSEDNMSGAANIHRPMQYPPPHSYDDKRTFYSHMQYPSSHPLDDKRTFYRQTSYNALLSPSSILGKHPLSLSTSCPIPYSLSNPNLNPYPLSYPPVSKIEMADMSSDDEALIQKFLNLNTSEHQSSIVVPQHAASSTKWETCLLAKVVSDKTVIDSFFSQQMLRAWKVHPATKISPVARNCFLLDFVEEEDKHRVLFEGPWTFRGDLVAIRQVKSQADLSLNHIKLAEVYVQFFDIPPNCLTDEGYDIVAASLGTAVSPPAHGFVGGRGFVKLKVLVPIGEPLKDRVTFTHPSLGDITALCSYEKVSSLCRFCGKIGHDIQACQERNRLAAIVHRPENAGRFTSLNILNPKFGPWILDPYLLPREQPDSSLQPNKRRFQQPTSTPHFDSPMNSPIDHSALMPQEPPSQISLNKRPRPAGQNSPAQLR